MTENRYQLTFMEKRQLEERRNVQKTLLQEMKAERNKRVKVRRRVLGLVLAILFIILFTAVNSLLTGSKSEALDNSQSERKTLIQKKDIHKTHTQVSNGAGSDKHLNVYNESIPMPKEHQEFLYALCKDKGLDYKKTLALVQNESSFDQNAINETNDYGYFQVNAVNHHDLAKKLNTDNSPLNPYINMAWGTYMLADLYSYWGEQGFKGERLDELVWSSYNKGITGFRKNGHATKYINNMKMAIQDINKVF